MKDQFDLDAALETSSQKAVRKWVESLPDEGPSMLWRSQLERRLRLEHKRRRVRTWFGLGSMVAAAAAAGLFLWLGLDAPQRTHYAPNQTTGVEEMLVTSHWDSVSAGALDATPPFETVSYVVP